MQLRASGWQRQLCRVSRDAHVAFFICDHCVLQDSQGAYASPSSILTMHSKAYMARWRPAPPPLCDIAKAFLSSKLLICCRCMASWTLCHCAQVMAKFGTDFQTMQKLMPGRTRSQLKGKYRRECKLDPERVDLALKGQVSLWPRWPGKKNKMETKILAKPGVIEARSCTEWPLWELSSVTPDPCRLACLGISGKSRAQHAFKHTKPHPGLAGLEVSVAGTYLAALQAAASLSTASRCMLLWH